MASAVVRSNLNSLLLRVLTSRSCNVNNHCRLISTSKKNKDGAAAASQELPSKIPDFSKPSSQNWVSYGFEYGDEKEDRNVMHSLFFITVTVTFVLGGFFYAYLPDHQQRDWAQREAFLQIRRKESAGLPIIDKNYIDPASIILPTDEELGDAEIII